MFAIICRRGVIRVPGKDSISVALRFLAHFSWVNSYSTSDGAGGDVGGQSLTISYLVGACGLPEKAAVSASKSLCIKSRENPDAVLELLKDYGFTDSQISRIVSRWPRVLQCRPDKTLMPKLELFRSIGVPDCIAAQHLSVYPLILQRSLRNHLIPSYDYLKRWVRSEERVALVFKRAPLAFSSGWPEVIPSNVAMLRERGMPDSCIASLVVCKPSMLLLRRDKLCGFVDRAAAMGFDASTMTFVSALRVFYSIPERTLQRKMEIYGSCGWSEHAATSAFLRLPVCMTLSETKIRACMDFLVKELGFKPVDVARCPALLCLNLERRVMGRWMVVEALVARGLMKKEPIATTAIATLFKLAEDKFVKTYIVDHQQEIPRLLDLYRGNLSLSQLLTSV